MNFIKKIKQIKVDKKNREEFKDFFRKEFADPRSQFNQFNLKLDADEETISTVISLPDNFDAANDAFKFRKLRELTKPINDYLIIKSSFVEYLGLPEFYVIEDAEEEAPTGNYLVVWKFNPVVLNDKKFWTTLALAAGGTTLGIGGIITALILLL